MDAQGYGRSIKNALIAVVVIAFLVGCAVAGVMHWIFS